MPKKTEMKLKIVTLTHDEKEEDQHDFRCAVMINNEIAYIHDTSCVDSDYKAAEKRAHQYTSDAFARSIRSVLGSR